MKQILLFFLVFLFVKPVHAVIPDNGEIVFEIFRNGESFGMHRLQFEENGNQTRVLINIEMAYKIGPIALFRYTHSNEEIWQGNKIISMTSQTYDDGKDYTVNAVWGDVLQVAVNDQTFEAPSQILTTSYWNPVTINSKRLLNTQKGVIQDIDVNYAGEVQIDGPQGPVAADHYKVMAKFPIDVWYDAKSREWVGLKFTVRGSEIEYRRIG